MEGRAESTGYPGAPVPPQPSPGTQAEANLTLGKQLAPPRRVLPWHFLELRLTELSGGEARLGRGHREVRREGQAGLGCLRTCPEGRTRSGEHRTWAIPELRAAEEVTESKGEKRRDHRREETAVRREARETGRGRPRAHKQNQGSVTSPAAPQPRPQPRGRAQPCAQTGPCLVGRTGLQAPAPMNLAPRPSPTSRQLLRREGRSTCLLNGRARAGSTPGRGADPGSLPEPALSGHTAQRDTGLTEGSSKVPAPYSCPRWAATG